MRCYVVNCTSSYSISELLQPLIGKLDHFKSEYHLCINGALVHNITIVHNVSYKDFNKNQYSNPSKRVTINNSPKKGIF